MVTRHYLIAGQVQGVGFRRFILKRVQTLGVRGWIRNLVDGRVEALLQGGESEVIHAEIYLRRGPQSGRVDRVISQEISADPQGEFRIEKDGEKVWEF